MAILLFPVVSLCGDHSLTFLRVHTVVNSCRFAVETSMLLVIVSEIKVFPVRMVMLLLANVVCCRHYSGTRHGRFSHVCSWKKTRLSFF